MTPQNCCPPTTPVQLPGAPGANAYTNTTANFVIPAIGSTVTVSVLDSACFVVGQNVIVSGPAHFQVTAQPTTQSITLAFLGWPNDSASGATIISGAAMCASEGNNAYTKTLTQITLPVPNTSAGAISVVNASWVVVGQIVVAGDGVHFGTFLVTNASAGAVTLTWLNYPGDSAQTTVISANATLAPGGVESAAATLVAIANGGTGQTTAAGALLALVTGTLTTEGDILAFNGSVPVRLPAGNNGQSIFADSTQVIGLKYAGSQQTLNVNITPATNTTTGATVMMSYALPGGTLLNIGDSVEVEAMFAFAANTNAKTIAFKFGSTTVITFPSAVADNGGIMIARARIICLGPTSQLAYAMCSVTVAAGTFSASCAKASPSETLSGTVTIEFVGTGGATADITQQSMITTYRSA